MLYLLMLREDLENDLPSGAIYINDMIDYRDEVTKRYQRTKYQNIKGQKYLTLAHLF